MNFSRRIYTPYNTYIYGLNEWSKSDLPLAFETTKIQSLASEQYLTIVFVVVPCPSWKGIRDGPTAASGSTARGSEAAAPGAPEFEY